jgi:hypothetical protein
MRVTQLSLSENHFSFINRTGLPGSKAATEGSRPREVTPAMQA